MAKRQPAIWAFLKFFLFVTRNLSHGTALAFGDCMGRIAYVIARNKMDEATARCSEILDIPVEEARAIVKRMCRSFGRSMAEFARMPIMASRLDECVRVHGEDNLKRALGRGKGAILVTAHLGNWEYVGAWLAQNGYTVNGMGTEQRDERITELISELRNAGGMKSLEKQSDIRKMVKALMKGEIVAIPIDQDAKLAGVLSPFLGHPASTPVGVVKLAAKFGCAVVPAFGVRAEDGVTLDFHILPEMEGHDGLKFGEDVQRSIDDCNEIISDWIRRLPDQWIWFYPRWESYERGMFDEVRD